MAPLVNTSSDVPLSHNEAATALSLDVTEPVDQEPASTAPPSKNDYLANARKAAQAQSLPKTRPDKAVETPILSLRGSSRIVLWGAASVLAVALVGGAYYLKNRADGANGQAEPAPTTPSTDLAPTTPAPDPFAEAPVEEVIPDGAAPETTS